MEIKIERIGSAEILEACADILVQAYNAAPWNDRWTKGKALEKLSCFYQSPKFIGWTASLDGHVIGCCVGNIEPYYSGDYFYLKEMFVYPHVQAKGIGAALMQVVKTELESLGIGSVILFTSKDFFPFDFYLKSGFQEMDGMRMMHFANDV